MLMTIVGTALILVGALMLYALVIRPLIRKTTWGAAFLDKIEAAEIALYKKSETMLVGRLVWVGGLLVSAYDALAEFAKQLDLTPLTTRIFDALHIPPDLRGLTASAAVMGLGFMIVKLRKDTTKPLALVAAPAALPSSTKAAIAQADAAKEQAVAAVKQVA
jgi:hypothetical protein